MKVLISALLLFVYSIRTNAQESVLEKYVQEGLKQNLSLQQHEFSVKKSYERLEQAKALFLPQLNFNANYTRAGGGRNIQFPVGDLLNPVYATLNQLTNGNNFPSIENVNEQFLPNDFHETKIRLIQPLFNSDIYYGKKAQEHVVAAEESNLEAFKNALQHDIRVAYFQYLQAEEALKIFEQTKTVLEELLRVNRKLVENEKATYDIIYSAEAELATIQSDIITAKKNIRVSRSYFNFLLHRDLSEGIEIDETVKGRAVFISDAHSLTADALASRKELTQLSHLIDANQALLKLNRNNAYLPQLNLVVDAGYQGFGYQFDADQDFWLAQVSLSWTIFKGGEKKSKIRESHYELERLNKQREQLNDQIELEVINAYHEYLAANEGLQAAQAQRLSARKSFRIVERKYAEDQVLLVEFLEAQNKHTTAELAYSIAEYTRLIRASELQKVIANN